MNWDCGEVSELARDWEFVEKLEGCLVIRHSEFLSLKMRYDTELVFRA